jgi:hypothetical protein
MTRARETLIDLDRTAYVHCISRCVRHAFLCGEDHLTAKNYEHRNAWVTERLDFFRTDDIAGLNVVGPASFLTHLIENISQKFIKGISISERLYT